MTGVYAPFIYTGGGHWLKHHVLLLDNEGCLVSVHPFQAETERTTAYTGIVLPAFQRSNALTSEALTPQAALEWLTACLHSEEGVTLRNLLERVLPEVALIPGEAVKLWNLEGVEPSRLYLDVDTVLRQIYP